MNGRLMQNFSAMVVAMLLGMASTHAENVSDHAIGPLHIGMTRVDFNALTLRAEGFTINEEGEEYPALRVFLSKTVTVEVQFVNDRIDNLSTSSHSYVTPEGARVGDTLARLRSLYPQGRVYRGSEEGLYFTFTTEVRGQVFRFDADALGFKCVVKNEGCRQDLEKVRARTLSIY